MSLQRFEIHTFAHEPIVVRSPQLTVNLKVEAMVADLRALKAALQAEGDGEVEDVEESMEAALAKLHVLDRPDLSEPIQALELLLNHTAVVESLFSRLQEVLAAMIVALEEYTGEDETGTLLERTAIASAVCVFHCCS